MKYIVTINNKEYEVEVEKGKAAVVGMKTVAPAVSTAAPAAPAPVAAPAAARHRSWQAAEKL